MSRRLIDFTRLAEIINRFDQGGGFLSFGSPATVGNSRAGTGSHFNFPFRPFQCIILPVLGKISFVRWNVQPLATAAIRRTLSLLMDRQHHQHDAFATCARCSPFLRSIESLIGTDNLGFAAALRFPLMGDQVLTPRRPTSGDGSDTLTRRHLGNSVERRGEVAARREELLQKRSTGELEERGLWDWISNTASSIKNTVVNSAKSIPSLFDGSVNCYAKGYPTFNTGCASKSTPFFRQGVTFFRL